MSLVIPASIKFKQNSVKSFQVPIKLKDSQILNLSQIFSEQRGVIMWYSGIAFNIVCNACRVIIK